MSRVMIESICAALLMAAASDASAAPLPHLSAETAKPRLDLYGDPLPDGAVARLGTVRFRPDGRSGRLN